jgi:hypothetical protein
MAVRNTKAGEETKLKFLEEDPSATLDVMQLDLGSLASVRKFAGDFRAQNLPLNILMWVIISIQQIQLFRLLDWHQLVASSRSRCFDIELSPTICFVSEESFSLTVRRKSNCWISDCHFEFVILQKQCRGSLARV